MWVPFGGGTVRLASRQMPCERAVEVTVNEARWLVVVLAVLSGDWSPVTDLKRSLTIALTRRNGDGERSG
jgi:hypothetical protein